MKWKFLGISIIAGVQGGLLAWQEWMQQQAFEEYQTNSHPVDVTFHIDYAPNWPPIVAMILSFLIFFYCLGQFFRLNAAVPIQRRRLKIMPRRE